MNSRVFALLLAFTILMSACSPLPGSPALQAPILSGSPSQPAQTSQPEDTPAPASESLPAQTAINPLTGLPVADAKLLERRPVMVKVSNFPRIGRPHAGLSFADMVFDYYIGYGTNRFLALYYGQDSPVIGPVRSGRRVDAQLVSMYSGILAYGSADNDTDAELVTTLGRYALSNLEAPCPAFCGQSTHDAIGVFANSAAISEFVTDQGMDNTRPDLAGMAFSEELPQNAKPAENVQALFNYYNRAEWRYDTESGKYLRWIELVPDEEEEYFEMMPLTDRVTGKQLAFDNIIIIFTEYTELAPSAHEIAIWSNDKGQRAVFFRNGLMTEGEWAAQNDTDPMRFFSADGQPYNLKPGNTWVVIAGINSSFKETRPGQWELFFFLP